MKDRILDKLIRFDILLGITAFVIALVAAFFSVYGISTLFAGAFLATAIMASSLEIGKLVTVTFLYRYWAKTRGFLKIYLSIATMILMLVTSLGIFGYLSSAYQKSSIEFKANQDKILMVESQKDFYTNLISQSELRIKSLTGARVTQESRLSDAMTNTFLSRNPIQLRQLQEQTISLITQANEDIKTEMEQVRSNQSKIMSVSEEVNKMRFDSAGSKDMQTFQFVADQFGTTLDKVAKWFIITLIVVFDPLAIALILAYNIVMFKPNGIVTEPPVTITPEDQPPTSDDIIPATQPEEPAVTYPADPIVNKLELIAPPELTSSDTIVITSDSTLQEPTEMTSSIVNVPVETPAATVQAGGGDSFYSQMFKRS
jgi:hypothetical protein